MGQGKLWRIHSLLFGLDRRMNIEMEVTLRGQTESIIGKYHGLVKGAGGLLPNMKLCIMLRDGDYVADGHDIGERCFALRDIQLLKATWDEHHIHHAQPDDNEDDW